jgi:hypothetical protein
MLISCKGSLHVEGSKADGCCWVLRSSIPPQVPTAHGKADLTLYRSEGRKVLEVLARLAKAERASIDE